MNKEAAGGSGGFFVWVKDDRAATVAHRRASAPSNPAPAAQSRETTPSKWGLAMTRDKWSQINLRITPVIPCGR
jgi:hypothetical protein